MKVLQSSKNRQRFTKRHGVTTQKARIFNNTAVKKSDFAYKLYYCLNMHERNRHLLLQRCTLHPFYYFCHSWLQFELQPLCLGGTYSLESTKNQIDQKQSGNLPLCPFRVNLDLIMWPTPISTGDSIRIHSQYLRKGSVYLGCRNNSQ